MYFMGWYTARMNPSCSPDMLAKELGLSRKVAHQINARLVKSGTITAPNALGISKTVEPLAESFKLMQQKAATQAVRAQVKTVKDGVERLGKLAEAPDEGAVEDVQDLEDQVPLEAEEHPAPQDSNDITDPPTSV